MGFTADATASTPLTIGADPPGRPGGSGAPIDRPRLMNRVRGGLNHPLTVLCAPPGFGKSVLVGQLLAGSSRFWTTRRSGRSPASAPTGPVRPVPLGSPPPVRPVPTRDRSSENRRAPVVLAWRGTGGGAARLAVVDDPGFETGGAESVAGLEALLRDRPAGPVVVACRPDSPISRWALSRPGSLVITEDDLAFTPDEVRQLIHQATGRRPSDRHVTELMGRTEGWPFAVRVAAADMCLNRDWDGVIAGLDGTHQRIAAFLRHEVLAGQPEAIHRFLMDSSVLEEVDWTAARMLGAGTEQMGGLEILARQRFFVRRSGGGAAATYRYFPMLRQTLRRELRRRDPGSERPLLVAAADWYDRYGEPAKAARYLIEAERWDALLDLVDRHGPRLYQEGRLDQVAGWLESVPTYPSAGRPRVRLRQALAWSLVGGADCAEKVSGALAANGGSEPERVVADVVLCRATRCERPAEAAATAGRAIDALLFRSESLPNPLGLADRARLLAMASLDRARALWLLGDTAASRSALRVVAEDPEVPPALRAEADGALALLEAWRRDHQAARERAGRVLAAWRRLGFPGSSAAADASLALAHVYREEGDADAAVRWLQGMAVYGPGTGAVAALAAVESALLDLSGGRPDEGLEKLHQYDLVAEAPPPPRLEVALRATRIRLHLLKDDVTKAEGVLRTASRQAAPGLAGVAVQLAVARSDLQLAARHLTAWPSGGSGEGERLEREMWEAAVAFESGHRRQALKAAGRVVRAAEEAQLFRMFVDAGPAVRRLLRSLARVEPGEYACSLVDGLSGGSPAEPDLLGLSAREREIIRYLPTSLSSAQMAARLYISVNTLKTHLRTIYRKLGVTGRREAIDRAERLGLA